jgi:hypothetical protein
MRISSDSSLATARTRISAISLSSRLVGEDGAPPRGSAAILGLLGVYRPHEDIHGLPLNFRLAG